MTHFETFEARRVTLKEARKADFREYERQVDGYKLCEEKRLDLKRKDSYYLAVYNLDKKMLGLIQVCEQSQEKTANVDISIPNKCWEVKYGKETLHQFIKCCLERKMYNYICLSEENSIAVAYRTERPKGFATEEYTIDMSKLK